LAVRNGQRPATKMMTTVQKQKILIARAQDGPFILDADCVQNDFDERVVFQQRTRA
jgi:hypothetical protein